MSQTRGRKLLDKLCENPEFGELATVFVIEAVAYYASNILKNPQPTAHGDNIISAIAWHKLAASCMEKIDNDRLTGQKVSEI